MDSLSLTGMKLVTWLEPDGSFNLLKLAAAPSAPAAHRPRHAAPAREHSAAGAGRGELQPWQFELRRFELHDASVSAEDRSTQPAAKIVVAPLSLQVDGISLDLAKPVRVALDTHINESGSLTLTGEVTPQPTAASLSLKLAGIDLTAAQPYIAQYTSMTLRSGQLGAEVRAALRRRCEANAGSAIRGRHPRR